jgi:hypothetical protein
MARIRKFKAGASKSAVLRIPHLQTLVLGKEGPRTRCQKVQDAAVKCKPVECTSKRMNRVQCRMRPREKQILIRRFVTRKGLMLSASSSLRNPNDRLWTSPTNNFRVASLLSCNQLASESKDTGCSLVLVGGLPLARRDFRKN